MATHYDILRVRKNSSKKEIKSSFRRLAKKYHPDSNPSRRHWAHEKMLEILAAYSVLSDIGKRQGYDKTLPRDREKELRQTYWERLRKKESNMAAQAKLLLFDLVRGDWRGSLKLYERLLSMKGVFNLMDYLSIPDYLDCTFLLAEAYEKAGDIDAALRLYRQVYLEDRRCSYFRHFSGEIKDRITRLCCRIVPRMRSPQEALGCFERMEDIEFPKKDRAFFFKKIAESYASLDDLPAARFYLDRTLSLYPRIGGLKKLLRKLNGA